MKMSKSLALQTLYALEARIVELNNRGSEPIGDSIASTYASLEVIREYLREIKEKE